MHETTPKATGATSGSLNDVVHRLLSEACQDQRVDRRVERRHPFFRPATIIIESQGLTFIPAFTREIYSRGIGLLHNACLPIGPVTIVVHLLSGDRVRLLGSIEWCQPCGAGWYLSGGRLTGVIESA